MMALVYSGLDQATTTKHFDNLLSCGTAEPFRPSVPCQQQPFMLT